jgi:hypothetical protein
MAANQTGPKDRPDFDLTRLTRKQTKTKTQNQTKTKIQNQNRLNITKT